MIPHYVQRNRRDTARFAAKPLSGFTHLRQVIGHHVDTTVLDANRPVSSANYEIAPSGVGREGDLLMTLRDAKTGKTLWAAAANGAASTPSQGLRKARSAYAAMADKLPKAGSGPSHE